MILQHYCYVQIWLVTKKLKPYSDSTYSKFALALFKSGYQPSDLFTMKPSKILEITQAQNLFLQELKIWISLIGSLYR